MILEKFIQSSETFNIPTEYLFSIRCDYCEHIILLVLPQPTYHRASLLKHLPHRHKIQMNCLLSCMVINKYHMWEPSKGLTHTHSHRHTPTCAHTHAQVYTYMHRERERHKPTYIHTGTHIHMRHTHTCTYRNAYTNIHTNIHIQPPQAPYFSCIAPMFFQL